MGKTVVVTSEEIRKEWTPEKLRALAATVPSFPDETTDEDRATGRVRPTGGRGFAAYKDRINRNGRPKSDVKTATVAIRLPESVIVDLRSKKGYSRILSDYIMAGISSGALCIR